MARNTDFRTWDSFVDEAQVPDYQLVISSDETIAIPNPTGVGLLRMAQGMRSGDLQVMLMGLTGDAWPRVEVLISKAPHGVLDKLVEELMGYFGFYEDHVLVGPGGGKVTEKSPRKIRQLLQMGYTMEGEARASRG